MPEVLKIALGLAIGLGVVVAVWAYASSQQRGKKPSRLAPRSGKDPEVTLPSTYDPTPGHDGFSP